VRLLGADRPRVLELTSETGEALDRLELDDAVGALDRDARAQRAHQLTREPRLVEAVHGVVGVEQLVHVVRAGVVADLRERKTESRIGGTQLDAIENVCVRDRARLRAEPPLLRHPVEQLVTHTRSRRRQSRRLRSLMSSVKPTLMPAASAG